MRPGVRPICGAGHAIRKFAEGKLSKVVRGLNEPNAIVRGKDVFYIADTNNHQVRELTADGKAEPLIVYEEMPRKREARFAQPETRRRDPGNFFGEDRFVTTDGLEAQ